MSRRLLKFGLKFAVSTILIAVVCRQIDPAALIERFADQSFVWLSAAAVVTAVLIGMAALRWDQILKGLGAEVPSPAVMSVSYMGNFFNAWLLGAAGGDVVRAVLAPAGQRGRAAIVHSIVFDRVVTLAGLGLVVLPLAVFALGGPAGRTPLFLSLGVTALPALALAALGPLARACAAWHPPLAGPIVGLRESWRRLGAAPVRFGSALAIGVLSQVAIPAVAYCLARAQHLDPSYLGFLRTVPPVMLLLAIPISAGGWGVREAAMVAALAQVGVEASSAVLISVQMALLAMLLSLPGGALWLVRYMRPARSEGTPQRVAVREPIAVSRRAFAPLASDRKPG